MEVNVNDSQIYSYEVAENEEISNSFNLSFIGRMCQFKISKYISIQQSDNIPIEIKYLLNPNEENNDNDSSIEKLTNNWFKFYLAPCVDDDYI